MIRQGIITKSTGSFYEILQEDKKVIIARMRGKIKLDNRRTTNPVAVGDIVSYEQKEEDFIITHIHPRKNYLIRKSVNLSKETQIIASNIDLACIVFTFKEPQTSLGFLDRFLVTCEAYQINPLIIFNKYDIYNEKDKVKINEIIKQYKNIGYNNLQVSSIINFNIDILKNELANKVSLFFGHSGSGKSTLINSLDPCFNIKIGDISTFNEKGQHTTTFAQMYPWNFGGYIIDTPGIKEFGVVDMNKEELQDYFPEILLLKTNCRFNNCSHTNEPDCAVINMISKSRYNSYKKMLDEI